MSIGQTEPAAAPPKRSTAKAVIVLAAIGGVCALCIPVGAAIGIPAFIRHVKHKKAAEARSLVASMAEGTMQLCRTQHQMPSATPRNPPTVHGSKQLIVPSGGLAQIGFAPTAPTYYGYSIVETATGVELVAEGDLDSDGLLSRFSITCVVADCTCGPLDEVQPLE